MCGFKDYNPITITVYFLSVSTVTMFCMNPVLLLFSLLGALMLWFKRNGIKNAKTQGYVLLMFVILSLLNPLVSHNGVTILFVMNDNPITLEALVYGIVTATMITAVIYWFRSYTDIMTGDKLLYVFSGISPRLAMILTMSLRFVPLYSKQSERVDDTQKAMGLYKEDNIIDTVKGKLRVFYVMLGWALENGIVTADSMSARGYGIGKRTAFKLFRFRRTDLLFTILTLALMAICLICLRNVEFACYPEIKLSVLSTEAATGYAAFMILVLMPVIIEVKEDMKWKYLRSKI